MKVQFDATLDDFVDITLRSVSRPHILIVLWAAASSGLGSGIILQFFLGSLAYSIIVGLAMACYTFFTNYNAAERRTRKLFTERYGIKGPVPIEVEITDTGISFRQQGTTTIHDWDTIDLIEGSNDAIYFRTQFGAYSAVRARAFKNGGEMREFHELAYSYRTHAAPDKSVD